MKEYLAKFVRRLAPRTMRNLTLLTELDEGSESVAELLVKYELQVRDLRAELNEMRRDNRRMAELYDLVFERLRDENPLT